MNNRFVDILIFNKKPKFKIGDNIREIFADNGYHKYSKEVYVSKIKKEKEQYFIYLNERASN